MELYWKTIAAGLLTAVLGSNLLRQEKDMAVVLSMTACVMVSVVTLRYLETVLEFMQDLRELGNLQAQTVEILMKGMGIGLVSQLAGQLCADGGNHALEKGIQLLGSAVILFLSIPVLEGLMDLIRQIMGEL